METDQGTNAAARGSELSEGLGGNPGPCACGGCEGFSCADPGGGTMGCMCDDKERYIRNVARGYWTGFHAPQHRAALIEEIRCGSLGEHSQVFEPLEQRDDKALAEAVLETWNDYVRCM